MGYDLHRAPTAGLSDDFVVRNLLDQIEICGL